MAEIDVELRSIIKEFVGPGNKRAGDAVRAVDNVNLTIHRGEFFAMLGPSGCGKTTTLRMIAGFEYPSSGEILIRGKQMESIPPFHRPVNTVFQDYALFPHMTVLDNVKFGLRMEGVTPLEATRRANEALEMVKLGKAATRRPNQLSGGQQQRVALARALVKRPAVLLLDEPLGALDLKLRKEMQVELKQMQQNLGITFIFVTHDQEEAMTMADRIAVMSMGRVLQVDTPKDTYEYPRNRFVADFIGETNFIVGEVLGKEGDCADVRLADETVVKAQLPDNHDWVRGKVTFAIRPERVGLIPLGEEDDLPKIPLNIVMGKLINQTYIGTDTVYKVKVADAEVVVRMQNVDYDEPYEFHDGMDVKIFFPSISTYILEND